jgi:hypothetical protein
VIARLYLLNNHLDIIATEDEKYDFIMNIASHKIILDEIVKWLEDHVR